jgi:hypothetical protein
MPILKGFALSNNRIRRVGVMYEKIKLSELYFKKQMEGF